MSYECDICGKTFANASNPLRHKKVVHAYGNRNLGQQTLTVNGDYSHLETFYRRCRIHKTCLLLKSQSKMIKSKGEEEYLFRWLLS